MGHTNGLRERLRTYALSLSIVALAGVAWWTFTRTRADDGRAPSRRPIAQRAASPVAPSPLVLQARPAESSAASPSRLSIAALPDRLDIARPDSAAAAEAAVPEPIAPVAHASATAASSAVDTTSVQHVALCDAFGHAFSLADAVQDCIDRATPFSTVELPAGVYELDRQLVIAKPITITTAGDGTPFSCVERPDRCAILRAAPDLLVDNGMLFVGSTRNVTLEHIVIDGNRAARQASIAAQFCLSGRTTIGFNAAILECANCRLEDVVSRNALCGSALVWSGRGALIQHSAFVDNGDATTAGMWSDGLTLLSAPDSEVRVNRFVNNSDVALIVGYAVRSRIEENIVVQEAQPAFAGIMLHNFGSDDVSFRGDFRDAVVTSNAVDCGPQMCVFGIQVGPRPWDVTRNIVGGDLHQNSVRGAKIGINADGAGTPRAPTRIFGNDVSDVPAGEFFASCPQPISTAWMNIAPTSAIDRHGELIETASQLSERCELSSAPVVVRSAN